jgi:uncharacterized delta-60 repeat protein
MKTLHLGLTKVALIILLPCVNVWAAAVLDERFGNGGQVVTDLGMTAAPSDVLIQPDGKLVVAGYFALPNSTYQPFLIRYNPDGSLDTTFGEGGVARPPFGGAVSAAAFEPDGTIVTAGFPAGGPQDFVVVRYLTNGSVDPSFGANGIVTVRRRTYNFATDVVVQQDGKIVVVGFSGGNHTTAFRLNTDGSIDMSFGTDGFYDVESYPFAAFTWARNVLLDNDHIIIANTYQLFHPNNYGETRLTFLDGNGQAIGGGGYGGAGDSTFAFDTVLLADGSILTVGWRNVIFWPDGSVRHVLPSSPYLYGAAALSDGKYVTTGGSRSPAELTGIRLHSPQNSLIGGSGSVRGSVTAQPDNKIIVSDASDTRVILTRLDHFTSQGTRTADFDSDDRSDIAVMRPTDSTLYVLNSSDSSASIFPSGEPSFEIRRVLPESFGMRLPHPLVYFHGANVVGSGDFCSVSAVGTRQCFQWGLAGDIPVGGDYDGDGFTDVAVYRPEEGVWYVSLSLDGQFRAIRWGTSGDKPVPADYDFDGMTDIAIYRPATGTWWVLRSSNGGYLAVQFGIGSDVPLTGDFDADGRADLTVYRSSEGIWYQFLTMSGFRATQFGLPTDVPLSGDYDGDGRHDLAVFRDGIWYMLQTSDGFRAVQWGVEGDVPVAVKYDQ